MPLIKQFKCDGLKVKIFTSREELGQSAAKDAAAGIRQLLSEQEEVNMIFAAAPSQNETLKYLLFEESIPWHRINAFHMDEYVGLPEGAPQSFGTYLRKHIFSKAPFRSVNYINGNAEDIQKECERYAKLLDEYPADIVMLGIGENGHIAFNDPGVADFRDPVLVKRVPLDEVCRMQQVHDGCFPAIDDVPRYALTLTIPALTRAGAMFCSVPASSKAEAVFRTVTGPISEECPATILRTHPHAVLYCDPDSGEKLL